MKILITLAAATLLCGCSAVYSPAPIGDTPVDITETAEEWAGTWLDHEGSAFLVTVTDASEGVLKVAWVEERDDNIETGIHRMMLRKTGDWTFISMKDTADEARYMWARIELKNRQAILWSPDADKFRVLVEEGILPGTVDKDHVYLGTLSSNHMAVVMSDTNGMLFTWDDPLVLRKAD